MRIFHGLKSISSISNKQNSSPILNLNVKTKKRTCRRQELAIHRQANMAEEEGFDRRVSKKRKTRCGFEENGGYLAEQGGEWRERRGMVYESWVLRCKARKRPRGSREGLRKVYPVPPNNPTRAGVR